MRSVVSAETQDAVHSSQMPTSMPVLLRVPAPALVGVLVATVVWSELR